MEAAIQKASTAAGKVKHLDHFAIPAMDLNRAERFYTEVLGGKVIIKDPVVPGGIFLKMGRLHHLGLFTQSKATIPKRETVDSYPRVAFLLSANEYEKTSARIKKACSVVKEIEDVGIPDHRGGSQGIGFIDSEGNILEIFKGEGENPIRVHHLHFDTAALDESVRFYTSILNLELIKRGDGKAILAIPTSQALVLHQVKELCEVTKTPYDERHFAFSVSDDDFRAIVDKLHGAGIREADELGGGPNRKPGDLGTYFKDPANGIHLQILNRDSTYFCQKHGFVIS